VGIYNVLFVFPFEGNHIVDKKKYRDYLFKKDKANLADISCDQDYLRSIQRGQINFSSQNGGNSIYHQIR
jgi:hypothetical protein